MILGRYLFTALGLNLKLYEKIVISGEIPYEECSAPIIDVSKYNFKPLTDKIVKLEESFIITYIDKCLESEGAISSMRIITDAMYEKADLNKFMAEQCQLLSTKEQSIPLKIQLNFEDLLDDVLGT